MPCTVAPSPAPVTLFPPDIPLLFRRFNNPTQITKPSTMQACTPDRSQTMSVRTIAPGKTKHRPA